MAKSKRVDKFEGSTLAVFSPYSITPRRPWPSAEMKPCPRILVGVALSFASAHPTPRDWIKSQWDAIIVGAGTAGIIVADRLSEKGLRTLLLEQGGPSFGITGGRERPDWLNGTNLSRVDVPGLCEP